MARLCLERVFALRGVSAADRRIRTALADLHRRRFGPTVACERARALLYRARRPVDGGRSGWAQDDRTGHATSPVSTARRVGPCAIPWSVRRAARRPAVP